MIKHLVALFVFGLLFTSYSTRALSVAGSGQVWYGPYSISKVARYWDNSGHRLNFHVKEPMNTSCMVNNNEGKATHWNSNDQEFLASIMSVGLVAQAQNKKIMLLLDKTCHSIHGLNVHGIEIVDL